MTEEEYRIRIAQERAWGMAFVRLAVDQMARDLGPGVYRRYREAQDEEYWQRQFAQYRQRWILGVSMSDARAYKILSNVMI